MRATHESSSARPSSRRPPSCAAPAASRQDAAAKPEGPRLEIYGFAQTDIGYDFNQVDPDWFDVLRVTKLPKYDERVRRGRPHLLQRAAVAASA